MKIPDELLKKWSDLRTHGDNKKIADQHEDITEVDISRAITTGECRDEVFEAIGDFYKEKEAMVNEYLSK